jgi:hypothetical protein
MGPQLRTSNICQNDCSCIDCYFSPLHSDVINSRDFKTIGGAVVDIIRSTFSQYKWLVDKRIVADGTSRRPDLQLDLGSHIVAIKVVEDAHVTRESKCKNLRLDAIEHLRLLELSQDAGFRPVVQILFNPGVYSRCKTVVTSCWKLNRQQLVRIPKRKMKEFDERIDTILSKVMYWIIHTPNKTITTMPLFFSELMTRSEAAESALSQTPPVSGVSRRSRTPPVSRRSLTPPVSRRSLTRQPSTSYDVHAPCSS